MSCWRGWREGPEKENVPNPLSSVLSGRREGLQGEPIHLSPWVCSLKAIHDAGAILHHSTLSPYQKHSRVRKVLCKESLGENALKLRGGEENNSLYALRLRVCNMDTVNFLCILVKPSVGPLKPLSCCAMGRSGTWRLNIPRVESKSHLLIETDPWVPYF